MIINIRGTQLVTPMTYQPKLGDAPIDMNYDKLQIFPDLEELNATAFTEANGQHYQQLYMEVNRETLPSRGVCVSVRFQRMECFEAFLPFIAKYFDGIRALEFVCGDYYRNSGECGEDNEGGELSFKGLPESIKCLRWCKGPNTGPVSMTGLPKASPKPGRPEPQWQQVGLDWFEFSDTPQESPKRWEIVDLFPEGDDLTDKAFSEENCQLFSQMYRDANGNFDKNICISVDFYRMWDLTSFFAFINRCFPGLEALEFNCQNYYVSESETLSFQGLPSTIKHLRWYFGGQTGNFEQPLTMEGLPSSLQWLEYGRYDRKGYWRDFCRPSRVPNAAARPAGSGSSHNHPLRELVYALKLNQPMGEC